MPKNTSKTSNLEADTLPAPSVLDFLYHDSRRIGSFLAQFEGDGHLQSLTRNKERSTGKRETSTHEGKANIGVASGKLMGETQISLEMQEGYARVFDPYWANARAFLDYLSDKNLLQRDIDNANLGQFVIATGYLNIQDFGMFKQAWKIQSFQKQIKSSTGNGKKFSSMTAAEKLQSKTSENQTDLLIDIMQILPHSVHARLITSDPDSAKLIWCTLNQEYLIANASDITLTYGSNMAGEWSMVGILSARPEYYTPDMTENDSEHEFGVMESLVGQMSKKLSPIVRVALGRPAAAHAITPLLIFRTTN